MTGVGGIAVLSHTEYKFNYTICVYAFVGMGPGRPRRGAVAVHMGRLVVLGLFGPRKIYVYKKIKIK